MRNLRNAFLYSFRPAAAVILFPRITLSIVFYRSIDMQSPAAYQKPSSSFSSGKIEIYTLTPPSVFSILCIRICLPSSIGGQPCDPNFTLSMTCPMPRQLPSAPPQTCTPRPQPLSPRSDTPPTTPSYTTSLPTASISITSVAPISPAHNLLIHSLPEGLACNLQ